MRLISDENGLRWHDGDEVPAGATPYKGKVVPIRPFQQEPDTRYREEDYPELGAAEPESRIDEGRGGR